MMKSIKDVGYIMVELSRDEYGKTIGADFSSDKEVGGIVEINIQLFDNLMSLPNTEILDKNTIRLGSYILKKVSQQGDILLYEVISNG